MEFLLKQTFSGSNTDDSFTMAVSNSLLTGWPHTLENRENGGKKFPDGKNQGI